MSTHADRLAALRAELGAQGLDGFLVPIADEHGSEYLPAAAERVAWLSGFTGSFAVLVVLPEKASLVVHSGRKFKGMSPSEWQSYEGERGRRGQRLPRGFQKVDRLEVQE
ncbi:MAG: aminopeptidase P family N-terminal domain-containing protein [Sphingomonadaceae bacterium]